MSTIIAIGAFIISALSLFLTFKKYSFDKKIYVAEQVARMKMDVFELIKAVQDYQKEFERLSKQITISEIDDKSEHVRKVLRKDQISIARRMNGFLIRHMEEKNEIMNEFKQMNDKFESLYNTIGQGNISHDPIKLRSIEINLSKRIPQIVIEANNSAKRWVNRSNEISKDIDSFNNLVIRMKKGRSKKVKK